MGWLNYAWCGAVRHKLPNHSNAPPQAPHAKRLLVLSQDVLPEIEMKRSNSLFRIYSLSFDYSLQMPAI